jgi:hypothetical protein
LRACAREAPPLEPAPPPEKNPDPAAGLDIAEVHAPAPDELDQAEAAVEKLVGLGMSRGLDLRGMEHGSRALGLIQNAFLHVLEYGGKLTRPKLLELLQKGSASTYGLAHYFEAVSALTIAKGTTKLLDPHAPPPWMNGGKQPAPEETPAARQAKLDADLAREAARNAAAVEDDERWKNSKPRSFTQPQPKETNR